MIHQSIYDLKLLNEFTYQFDISWVSMHQVILKISTVFEYVTDILGSQIVARSQFH